MSSIMEGWTGRRAIANYGQPQPKGQHRQIWQTTLLTQPDSETKDDLPSMDGHELDSFLGKAFDEKPIWKDLYENIHDVFFPPKLPPLVLTSTPIPVPDRMAVKANPWAIGIIDLYQSWNPGAGDLARADRLYTP